MGTIRALNNGLKKVNLPQEIPKIIERTGSQIIKLNQDQLYKLGQDSLGQSLAKYNSFLYSIDKHKLNPNLPFGSPDLKLTGSFYKGFFVSAGYTGIFTVDSRDSKASKLEAKYGINIYGLNRSNKTKYAREVFYPQIQTYITGKTGLVFR